jgi:hypothetical protein
VSDVKKSCECELVRRHEWGYEEPRSLATLDQVSKESINELVERTEYRCRQCGAKLVQEDEDHAPTTWNRSPTS